MSLWDKDKNSINRSLPRPHSKDININRLAHGTTAFTLKQDDTDTTLAKLTLKDGVLKLEVNDNVYVDASNGNIEVKRTNADIFGRLGYRSSDSEGAIDIAKPGDTV